MRLLQILSINLEMKPFLMFQQLDWYSYNLMLKIGKALTKEELLKKYFQKRFKIYVIDSKQIHRPRKKLVGF